jgi:hypothetical protein
MRNAKKWVQMANVLSLHERCSSEHKQKDIKAAKDQKSIVRRLKEHGIAGHLRSSHGGLEDGGVDGGERYKGTGVTMGINTPETARVTHMKFEILMFYYGSHSTSTAVLVCVADTPCTAAC